MSEQIEVCPDCDGGGIRRRFPEHPTSTAEHQYYCTKCHASFDEPAVRTRKSPGGLSGLARRLDQADQEEVL